MSNIFIIHGAYGHPQENWFPWLKAELEKNGHTVFVPSFPTPEDQTPEKWLEVFVEYEKYLNADSIVIGHSVGANFTLWILGKVQKPVTSAFLVAPVSYEAPEKFQVRPFVDLPYSYEELKKYCPHFFVFHADNDPYNSLSSAQKTAQNLGAELTVIPNGGHLNASAGFTAFPELLNTVQSFEYKVQK